MLCIRAQPTASTRNPSQCEHGHGPSRECEYVGDIRALAASSTGQLFGIRDVGGPDELVRIDTATGVVTAIGPTGFTGIQAMDFTGAGLRGWDVTAGLLLISTQSGIATDPFPGLGGPAGMQFLTTDPVTNQTFVGRGTMFALSTSNGTTGQSIAFAGTPTCAAPSSRLRANSSSASRAPQPTACRSASPMVRSEPARS